METERITGIHLLSAWFYVRQKDPFCASAHKPQQQHPSASAEFPPVCKQETCLQMPLSAIFKTSKELKANQNQPSACCFPKKRYMFLCMWNISMWANFRNDDSLQAQGRKRIKSRPEIVWSLKKSEKIFVPWLKQVCISNTKKKQSIIYLENGITFKNNINNSF